MRVPFSWHPHQHLLLMVFLMIVILTGVRWNLSVVLIFISFMARDGEHFFMCFLAIWISSFEIVLFSSFAHFFIHSLILGEFSFLSFLHGTCKSMHIAALFTIAKLWKQPRCHTPTNGLRKCVYTQWNFIQPQRMKFCHLQVNG
jgi:hypothetical protein